MVLPGHAGNKGSGQRWRRSRQMFVCVVLAVVLYSTVFLCHLGNSVQSCYEAGTVFAVCMMIVAVVSETVAFSAFVSFCRLARTAILVMAPTMQRLSIYGLPPPHLRQASFLTPLRI